MNIPIQAVECYTAVESDGSLPCATRGNPPRWAERKEPKAENTILFMCRAKKKS